MTVRERWRGWSAATQVLLVGLVAVVLLPILCAVYVALFLEVTTPVVYLVVIPIAAPIAAIPVALFLAAFGFGPRARLPAAVVGIVYGAVVLGWMTVGLIDNAIYTSAQNVPPGEPFEPDALDLALITMPGALAVLVAGVVEVSGRLRHQGRLRAG